MRVENPIIARGASLSTLRCECEGCRVVRYALHHAKTMKVRKGRPVWVEPLYFDHVMERIRKGHP